MDTTASNSTTSGPRTTVRPSVIAPPFSPLAAPLQKDWGWVALRGAIGILFGILAISWPVVTIWTLAILWGAFAMADGVFAFMTAWRIHKTGARWWPYLLVGLIGVAAGIITLFWPGITIVALVYVIAFWALFGGISQIVAAVRLRKEIQGEWLLILAGAFSVIFGMLILFRPLEGLLAIAWIVGFYAILTGALYLMLAFRLRRRGSVA